MPAVYLNTALLKGGKNRLINGAFVINQRNYISGTNLASGAYGFDRWKSGFTNTALTFTAGSQATTVTISTSGVLQQIVERENIPAGTYVLSWTGTATGRVYNSGGTAPAYAASPVTVTLDGLANVVVEFTASGSSKTLGTVQLEAGTVPTPFEYRHRGEEFILCQRYFQRDQNSGGVDAPVGWGSWYSANAFWVTMYLPVAMRAAPTVAADTGTFLVYTATANYAVSAVLTYRATPKMVTWYATTTSSPTLGYAGWMIANTLNAGINYTAEL